MHLRTKYNKRCEANKMSNAAIALTLCVFGVWLLKVVAERLAD